MTTNEQTTGSRQPRPSRSIITQVRELMPIRPISVSDAKRVAHKQAIRLRTLLGETSPALNMDTLTALPRIDVSLNPDLAASGSTHWSKGAWRVQINANEALVRQRFTLAHELKHVIDAPHLDKAYKTINARIDGHNQIEAICDYFAACLLMPSHLVKQLWGDGLQNLDALAAAFDVSAVAMKRRLQDLGLVDRMARSCPPQEHATIAPDWFSRQRTKHHRNDGHPSRRIFHRRSRTYELEAA